MAAITPIVSRQSVQYVELLLFSKFPKETQIFYEALGYSLQKASSLAQKNNFSSFLRLIDSTHSGTGLNVVLNRNVHIENLTDPDNRIVSFTGNASFHLLPIFPEHWVTLLRTADLEKTKKFYDFLGNWQKEQHSSGPMHYSNEINKMIFEIYPLRKKYPSQVEFILNVRNFKDKKEQLINLNFNPIKEDQSSTLFKDPDDRLIQIMEMKKDE